MKRLVAILLSVAALSSCQKKVTVIVPGHPVKFAASVESYSTKATDSSFEDGDKVRIVAGSPIDATAVGTISGMKIVPDKDLYWEKNQEESTTFAAIYQPGEVAEASTTLSYDLLQGGVHDFDTHNLFLTAVATVEPREDVNFNFTHPFSKIVFDVDASVTAVQISGLVMDATLDVEAGTVSLGKTGRTFSAVSLGAGRYGAIVMPQMASPVITVTTSDGNKYTFTSSENFAAGVSYSATLTLEDGAGPVSFSFTVVPWSDGGSLDYRATS